MTIPLHVDPSVMATFGQGARRHLQCTATTPASVTAQHPQLRDLIARSARRSYGIRQFELRFGCSTEEGDVVHLNGKTIATTSCNPKRKARRLPQKESRLIFRANCLAAAEGLVCAGGQNTEASIAISHKTASTHPPAAVSPQSRSGRPRRRLVGRKLQRRCASRQGTRKRR
jgi:hypothetical protein